MYKCTQRLCNQFRICISTVSKKQRKFFRENGRYKCIPMRDQVQLDEIIVFDAHAKNEWMNEWIEKCLRRAQSVAARNRETVVQENLFYFYIQITLGIIIYQYYMFVYKFLYYHSELLRYTDFNDGNTEKNVISILNFSSKIWKWEQNFVFQPPKASDPMRLGGCRPYGTVVSGM